MDKTSWTNSYVLILIFCYIVVSHNCILRDRSYTYTKNNNSGKREPSMTTFMKRSSVSQSRSPQKVWCPSSVFSFQEYPWDYWEYSKLLWIMDYPKMRQWIVWGKWEKCFASSILNQVLIQVLHSVLSSLLHCWTVWLPTLLFVKRNQTLLLTNNKQISWKAAY